MTAAPIQTSDAAAIAAAFVSARLSQTAVPDYPGVLPTAMSQAYAIQDAAIALFPDTIIGWKVGGVPPEQQSVLGIHRLAGPIFARNQWADSAANQLPVIEGGFAAVEAEFIARIGVDADPAKLDWTVEEAMDQVDAVFIGIELAGSPLSAINALGSAIVASDFGNNGGLLVGQALDDWRDRMDAITVETVIDGVSVGKGGALSLAGGAMESVRFLLEHCARRGRPLAKGILVSTGAVTGVHRVYAGSDWSCDFRGVGLIKGVTAPATT